MNPIQEQLIALGAVFQAAVMVDKIAKTGQAGESEVTCLIGSLLVRDANGTLDVYGGDDLNLRDGYRALVSALERDPASLQRDHCATPSPCSAWSANSTSAVICWS